MQPDVRVDGVIALLQALRRRRLVLDSLEACAAGVSIFAAIGWLSAAFMRAETRIVIAAAVSVAAGIWLLFRSRHRRTLSGLARAVEAARTNGRNLIVTAEELHRYPQRASPWMRSTVMARASEAVAETRIADVAPPGRAVVGILLATAVATGATVAPPPSRVMRSVASVRVPGAGSVERGAGSVLVTVRPPSYAQLAEASVRDPQRLDVLEGSVIALSTSGAASRSVRFGTQALGVLDHARPIQFIARESGYFAVESARDGVRDLILLSVTPDRAPAVKIDQPARDLLLADANRQVQVKLSASDDLGLKTLELRYTRISGAGERFEFQEGTLPIHVERATTREWRADAAIALRALALTPGDAVIYRAVAMDQRRETGLNASDTFFIEIAGPGQVPLEGVDMPPEQDRYALSQQMIVLKIERLKAVEKTMARDAVAEQAAGIAGEQRSIRANFIFLLGGYVEDEEEEAAQSTEISEGRLMNTAQRDINAAIREMTRTEQRLIGGDTSAALVAARTAAAALQRAFGHSRYFLRTAAVRGGVDPSRRLTGNLADAAAWRRATAAPSEHEGNAARALLGDLFVLSSAVGAGSADRASIHRFAERALRIDPASPTWQEIARRLGDLSTALERTGDAPRMMDDITRIVVREADRGLLPRTALAIPPTPLQRAWKGGRR